MRTMASKHAIDRPLASARPLATCGDPAWCPGEAFHGGGSIDVHPDGHLIALGCDRSVVLLDAATGLPTARAEGGWSVRSLRFSRDGASLWVAWESGVSRFAVPTLARTLHGHEGVAITDGVWDALDAGVIALKGSTEPLVLTVEAFARPPSDLRVVEVVRATLGGAFRCEVALSPDGHHVALFLPQAPVITLLDLRSPAVTRRFLIPSRASLWLAIFTPDGAQLWLFDTQGQVWTLPTSAPDNAAPDLRCTVEHAPRWERARWSLDGRSLYVASRSGVFRFDREGGESPDHFAIRDALGVVAAPDQRTLYVLPVQGGIHRIDTTSREVAMAPPSGECARLVWQDDDTLVRVSRRFGSVLWRGEVTVTCRVESAEREPVAAWPALLASPEGRYVASAPTNLVTVQRTDAAAGRRAVFLAPLTPSPFAVDDAGALYVWSAGSILERWPLTRSAAMSPPETWKLVRAAKKKAKVIPEGPLDPWRMHVGLRTPHGPRASWSPDGQRLVLFKRGGPLVVIDLARWEIVATHGFDRLVDARFAGDDALVIVRDKRVEWRDVRSGTLLDASDPCPSKVGFVAATRDGEHVIVGDNFREVAAIRRGPPCRVVWFDLGPSCGQLALSADGRKLAISSALPTVSTYDLEAMFATPSR
jgi:hypothetical protein